MVWIPSPWFKIFLIFRALTCTRMNYFSMFLSKYIHHGWRKFWLPEALGWSRKHDLWVNSFTVVEENFDIYRAQKCSRVKEIMKLMTLKQPAEASLASFKRERSVCLFVCLFVRPSAIFLWTEIAIDMRFFQRLPWRCDSATICIR